MDAQLRNHKTIIDSVEANLKTKEATLKHLNS